MTTEDKELLLKDLCARFPYGVILKVPMDAREHFADKKLTKILTEKGQSFVYTLMKETDEDSANILSGFYIEHVKPYLRPMSSMTEEERKEYKHLVAFSGSSYGAADLVDWLNKKMFAYRTIDGKDMFELCLAIEAPEGMYN